MLSLGNFCQTSIRNPVPQAQFHGDYSERGLRLEFVMEDSQTEQAVGLIERAATSDRHSDGSIFVIPVAEAI